MMKLNVFGNAKRRTNFQLIAAAFAFAFSCIILGIGVAAYNKDLNNAAYSAALVFAMLELGTCVAMLALWVALFNSLRPVEVVRKVISTGLAVFTIILAYIACVVIVDALNLSTMIADIGKVAWEAINGIVVAFTGIGLITAIVSCVMIHAAANKLNEMKDRFVGVSAKAPE